MLPPVKYEHDIWNVYPEFSSAFLVVGKEKALLIDTGHDDQDLPAIIKTITPLPVIVVNTHAHSDHMGGNARFGNFYLGEADMPLLTEKKRPYAIPVNEGFKFDLGGRVLKVISIPGHTPGSIGILERETGCFFAGDMVEVGPIFFIQGSSDIDDFEASIKRLMAMDEIKKIYVCHGENYEVGKDVLGHILEALKGLRAGTLRVEPFDNGHHKGVLRMLDDVYGFTCPDD